MAIRIDPLRRLPGTRSSERRDVASAAGRWLLRIVLALIVAIGAILLSPRIAHAQVPSDIAHESDAGKEPVDSSGGDLADPEFVGPLTEEWLLGPRRTPKAPSARADVDPIVPVSVVTDEQVPEVSPEREKQIHESLRRLARRRAAAMGATHEAPRTSYLELCWILIADGIELTELGGSSWSEAERDRLYRKFRNWIFDLALSVSAALGPSDNPRDVMLSVVEELFQRRGYRVVGDDSRWSWARLHLPPLMAGSDRASADSLALVFLAVAEVVRPGMTFHFVPLPGAASVRYEADDYEVNVLLSAYAPVGEWTRAKLRGRFRIADHDEARGAYLRPLTQSQLRGRYALLMGREALAIGLRERARELFVSSTKLQRVWPGAEVELARLAELEGDAKRALKHVGAALEIAPRDFDALDLRARLRFGAGDVHGARRDLKTLLVHYPTKAGEVERVLGDLARVENRWEDAIGHYENALLVESRPDLRGELQRLIDDLTVRPEIEMLHSDASYSRRFEAVERVARRPNADGVVSLMDALDDENLRFARIVWKALREITGEELGFSRESWIDWWSREGRESARWRAGEP